MKNRIRKISLYAMAAFYFLGGVGHLVMPEFYLMLMPEWLPWKIPLIIISGVAEMALAIALLKEKTQKSAAWLIIAMLVVYLFVNHVNMSVDFFQSGHTWFVGSLVRIVLQIPLIWWAWTFTKEPKR